MVLVVVKLLLLSQVFVLGRLKTHGDHLRAGQHLAPFDLPFLQGLKTQRTVPEGFFFLFREPVVLVGADGGMMVPEISSLPAACTSIRRQQRQAQPLHGRPQRIVQSTESAPSAGQNTSWQVGSDREGAGKETSH